MIPNPLFLDPLRLGNIQISISSQGSGKKKEKKKGGKNICIRKPQK
jgi:hypothetical protein